MQPITFYPGDEQEEKTIRALLPAMTEAIGMRSESAVIRHAIRELAQCQANLPGGERIAAILANEKER